MIFSENFLSMEIFLEWKRAFKAKTDGGIIPGEDELD
jgi:hypothetical protein